MKIPYPAIAFTESQHNRATVDRINQRHGDNYDIEWRELILRQNERPARMAITQKDADTLVRVLQLDAEAKKKLDDCVKASEELKLALLKSRAGYITERFMLKGLMKNIQEKRQAFGAIVKDKTLTSTQVKELSSVKEVLGFKLQDNRYQRSRISDYYFPHVFDELSGVHYKIEWDRENKAGRG